MPFTVATWNVENLSRPDPSDAAAQQHHQDKVTLIANTLQGIDADVVGFQELFGDEPLFDVQQAMDGLYPHRAISNFPDRRGIRVGFLSKLPIDQSEDVVDFPPGPALAVSNTDADLNATPLTRMGRGALRIRVNHGGSDVHVITAHLKSKLLTFPTAGGGSFFSTTDENLRAQVAGIALQRRAAEAVTLRTRANALLSNNADTPLIVMGDFNDGPHAASTQILQGKSGSEIGTRGFNLPDAGDDARLFNTAPLIPEDRRFSRRHSGVGELLDQIFASEELFPRDENGDRQTGTADSHIDFAAATLPSLGENPNARALEVAPDHSPVSATFAFDG